MKTRSQQGVALVITLILLSVITFMAVTFLVVSRHEGANVDVLGQQSSAKFAADAAYQEAVGQIVANMLATGNGLNFGLLVSTNYINGYGFKTGITSLTNVSYNSSEGGPISTADLPTMLHNLMILPRAPVFVTNPTNKNVSDFRYYLDLNRNGAYDANGAVVESTNGRSGLGNIGTNIYVGDPEWIGILNHPDQPHSSSNLFVGRYAFIAVPIGNNEDINYIHNHAKTQFGYTFDGFLRNQGVGSWEINLAGFLNGLNTNIWGYNYTNSINSSSIGTAFQDANSLLEYRYNGSYQSLSNFTQIYTNVAAPLEFGTPSFPSQIDGYSQGPLMLGTQATNYAENNYNYWPGNNPNSTLFTSQDFFNSSSYLSFFSNRLQTVGTGSYTNVDSFPSSANSYNRYTYYRMLAQLGTDSSPEPSPYPYTNKINLNYNNLTPVYSPAIGNSTASPTNFLPWTPIAFFTNAADRMLRLTFPNPVPVQYSSGIIYTNISINNIPIYPTNFYTPSIQRILQLAANIYDASVYKPAITNTDIDYPSVFRPLFTSTLGDIHVSGYVEVGPTTTDLSYQWPPESLQDLPTNYLTPQFVTTLRQFMSRATNIYGIPWIIGAKRGFPNFNEFVLMNSSTVTRKLQFTYNSAANPAWTTNVQYTIGISNAVALQTWNSYATSPYANRSMQLRGFNSMSMVLSNETLIVTNSPSYFTNYVGLASPNTNPFSWNFPIGLPNNSIVLPLSNNLVLVPYLVYHQGQNPPLSTNAVFDVTGNNQQRIFPQLILNATNRLQYVMIDNKTGRVIDYVHFDGMNFSRNLIGDLAQSNTTSDVDVTFGGVWRTNFINGAMQGIKTQIQLSEYGIAAPLQYNDSFPTGGWVYDQLTVPNTVLTAQTNFQNFLKYPTNTVAPVQAPFTPTAQQVVSYAYQVNDPLVHYTLGDLTRLTAAGVNSFSNSSYLKTKALEPTGVFSPNYMLGIKLVRNNGLYGRYDPWIKTAGDANSFNMAVKDPMVTGSDAWQFPTNKYPNIGWLGRVHRGTPWQTVYLKSGQVDPINWAIWTGNPMTNYFRNSYTAANSGITIPGYPGIYDSIITMPTNDWALLDLFTTAPNDNASRGQLSVNQTNLAAWAAVLDGVITLTNDPVNGLQPWVISPTDTQPSGLTTIQTIVNSINAVRTNYPNTNSGSGAFSSVGQILSVPILTTNSPYINWTNRTATNLLTDAVVERIPQQILSLLRLGSPRYVIYAYGQSLKPANNSIVQNGNFFGMCTNYQITGEVATRTVMRIENYPIPGVNNTKGYHPHAVIESFNVLPPE